ncbi:MAG: cysteine-rich KTR domain-containing protein [Candidatus Limivicinus sp.]
MRVTEKGFLCCPKCGGKTKTKVLPGTVLKHFPLFCPWCKRETIIDIQEKPEPERQS